MLKHVLITVFIWTCVVGLFFILQIFIDGTRVLDTSLTEQLNTFFYGLVLIIMFLLLQLSPKFPSFFETKWFLFHLIISLFSYLIYNALFVKSILLPEQDILFFRKQATLGNIFMDKIFGNGFGIYAIVLFVFSIVFRKIKKHDQSIDNISTSTFEESLKVKLANRTYFVRINDIIFIKSSENYSDLYTESGKHTIRETLKSLEEKLNPNLFLRIHRSMIIKLDEVEEFISSGKGDYQIKMKNQEIVNVGKKYKKEIMKVFNL